MFSRNLSLMLRILRVIAATFSRILRSRRDLLLENLVLRQQLAVLARKQRPVRPRLADKLFRIVLHRLWSGWRKALLIVEPSTVAPWHLKGFKLYLNELAAWGTRRILSQWESSEKPD
jgi:hypothetical protein